MSRMIDYGAPTCGTCQHWQIVDVSQLVDGTPRERHLGRCRSGSVPGWASARSREREPFREAPDCYEPVAAVPQEYGAGARRVEGSGDG